MNQSIVAHERDGLVEAGHEAEGVVLHAEVGALDQRLPEHPLIALQEHVAWPHHLPGVVWCFTQKCGPCQLQLITFSCVYVNLNT